MKRDDVYSAMAAAGALPAEIAAPDRFLDFAIRRSLAHTIRAAKNAGVIPARFTCRLVWVGSQKSARGKALGGTCFTSAGYPPVLALTEDCAQAGAAAFVVAHHELVHAFGIDDEAAATSLAWKMAAPALAVVNAELEAATTGEAAGIAWQMIHPGDGGRLRPATVLWPGDRGTVHGPRQSVRWAGDLQGAA